MNRREKILAGSVAGIVALFVVGFGLRAFFLKPLKEIDQRTTVIREKIEKVKADRRAFFTSEDRMKAVAFETFADNVDQASAKSGEMLTRKILESGLPEEEFTRLPVGPRKLRGASEVGWNVQGDGPLANAVNLLFLLETSPYVHRVENVSISAGDSVGQVRVHFRYLTLVLEPGPDVTRTNLVAHVGLESLERHLLDGIVSRDLLRPYIKRPPTAVAGQPPVNSGKPGTTPGPESFRIVSLSEWQGEPEVHVRDLTNQRTQRYKPGDSLAGGLIVMVDYRSMPMPGSPVLQSFSRVIVRIESEYWAIERGKTLADKHKLSAAELPTQLAKAK
jgi:hypothetical protein